MSEFKEMSHADAIRINNRPEFNRPSLNGTYEFVSSDYEMTDRGVAKKVSKKVLVDPKVEFSKYRVSDFALENIIAAGAEGSLKEMSLSYGSMEAEDMATRLLDQIEDLENNANKNYEE